MSWCQGLSPGVSRLQTNSRDGGTQHAVGLETAGPGSSGSGTRQWIRQDLDVDTARPNSSALVVNEKSLVNNDMACHSLL